jgi:cytochrome c1
MTIRREQVREAITRHRKRRKHGVFWRPILVTKSQLDQLEQRGYLDHGRRGDSGVASFIAAPQAAIPGNKMGVFQGVSDKDGKDIIAFLATQK